MGRHCGYLPLMAAVAAGAELAIVPEIPMSAEIVVGAVRGAYARGKSHCIIVLGEGTEWTAQRVCDALCAAGPSFESRPVVLGHVQHGGAPTVFDRLLATRLGAAAAEALAAGEAGFVVGLAHDQVVRVPLAVAIAGCNKIDPSLYQLATVLAQ